MANKYKNEMSPKNEKVDSMRSFTEENTGKFLTTNQNLRINDNQNSLKAGDRGQEKSKEPKKNLFETFSAAVTKATGSSYAFIIAFSMVLIWGLTGPVFNYSENWQLVINTSTTIITFLMVFLIQKSQNKDSMAIQLKLNELVAAHEFASNRLVDVENMTEDEMKTIQKYYSKLSTYTQKEESMQVSHSIDEAEDMHDIKKGIEKDIKSRISK